MKRLLFLLLALAAFTARAESLDDGGDWKASASDQVKSEVRRNARGDTCLRYDFGAVSGYAVMRRERPLEWPAHFKLRTRLSGQGAGNELQLKFVDASGDNVWWVTQPNFAPEPRPTPVEFKRRQVVFAWGPTEDKRLQRSQTLEWVVVRAPHGAPRGELCVGGLERQAMAAPGTGDTAPQVAQAPGQVSLHLSAPHELAGLWMDWPKAPGAYRIEASEDGRHWRALAQTRRDLAGADASFLGAVDAMAVRVRYKAALPAPRVEWREPARWPNRNAMLAEWAAALPEGELPRAFRGQQNYWTVVGVDGGGARSGLLSEDGALELFPGGPSLEPALRRADGRLVTWAQVGIQHRLRGGFLPQPRLSWQAQDLTLDIEAGADGPASAPQLLTRYRVRNTGDAPQTLSLLLSLRPWQVNPPQQFLNLAGGLSAVKHLAWDGQRLRVDGHQLVASPRPERVSATSFSRGPGLQALIDAPALHELTAPLGQASAQWRFDLRLAPGGVREIDVVSAAKGPALSARAVGPRLDAAAQIWQARLGRVGLQLPPAAGPLAERMRAALAQILVSRDGPWLRPGTRSYARTWIRDGAMMVSSLVRLGEIDAARDFIEAYRGILFDSGKVPCCFDARGADPVVENDSHGEYLFAVAEVWRQTQDLALLRRHAPAIERTVAYLDALRRSERPAGGPVPGRERFYGLLPPSISHEGYSDKPAYAYWDDFWALRGYKDAVQMARAQGDEGHATAWAASLAEFEQDLAASLRASTRHYGQALLHGAADRGDVDPTSTTVALNPAQAQALLEPEALHNTYERYVVETRERASHKPSRYTPYELRNVSALTRLGRADDAQALLDFFYRDARPRGWWQWAEVVVPDPRTPEFLGDMPHAWVSSDFLRAALDLLAYEDEPHGDLVLFAGATEAWRQSGDLGVSGLATAWGRLDARLSRAGKGWRLRIDHLPERLPGQIRLAWPGEAALPQALVAGQPLEWTGRELKLPRGTIQVELRP